jgi:glycosyltransferase involved in cell wall biosynthesis
MVVSSLEAQLALHGEDRVVGRQGSFHATNSTRVAILCDIVEENWPSMDLVGEMLYENLRSSHADKWTATRLSPPLRRRFTRIRGNGHFFNADRFLNRFWDYQRWLQSRTEAFDLFHVIDHSYSQLLHHLPPERTIVTCHDLDTFRCLIEPQNEPRSIPFRKMMAHVLNGFRKAAVVVCDSSAIRDELLNHRLIASERLRVVPLGVHPSCIGEPDPAADAEAKRLLDGGRQDAINLLHVASTIARKRIDVLLEVFAGVRKEFPETRLIRVGGPFTPAQLKIVRRLNLDDAIIVLPHLSRDVLAAVYRQATLVLQPSDEEGFGLPVIEAMACGTPVVASDLPVLREVGGRAASYAPVADVSAWTELISRLLHERDRQPEAWLARRAAGKERGARFSWMKYTENMIGVYQEVLGRPSQQVCA